MLLRQQAPSMGELLEGPAMEPPLNTTPDFENPGGSHALGYGIVIFGSVVAAIATIVRLGSRYLIKKFDIEDGFMVSALGLFAGYQYIMYKSSIFPGMEVHQWNMQLKHLPVLLYDVHIGSILYGMSIMCLKIAILLDWLRIFVPKGQRNPMFWSIHILIWANAILYIAGNFAEIFQCTPREKIWNVFYEGGSCHVNIAAQNFSAGILNLLSDVVILVLPQYVIWNLNMPMGKRIGVSLLFTIGVFICVCAAARIVWLDRMLRSEDILYWMSIHGLWGIGEMAAGFLILGIPSAPMVFQNLPFSDSVVSLIRSITNNSAPSNRDWVTLPEMPRPVSRKRRGLWEISALETHEMTSMGGHLGTEGVPDATSSDTRLHQTK